MAIREGRKAGAVQSQPLSSHGWEGKQTLIWLALLLYLPLPSILELQSSQGTPFPPFWSDTLFPTTSPFCKSQPSIMPAQYYTLHGSPYLGPHPALSHPGQKMGLPGPVALQKNHHAILTAPHNGCHCAQRHISQSGMALSLGKEAPQYIVWLGGTVRWGWGVGQRVCRRM